MSGDPVAEITEIAKLGYTILERVFDADLVDAVAADLARLEGELGIEPAGNSFEGARTLRVYNLLAHGPALGAHWRSTRARAARSWRGSSTRAAWCARCRRSGIRSRRGGAADPRRRPGHPDSPSRIRPDRVQQRCWALTDFTAANGATRVIPGSHLRDRSAGVRHGVTTRSPAEMARGGVLVWHGSLWHGGGANRHGTSGGSASPRTTAPGSSGSRRTSSSASTAQRSPAGSRPRLQ